MSFVSVKATAQPPTIPHVCLSFCLAACLGTLQKGLIHPSLDLTACLTAFLKGVKGLKGLWANGGMWWEEEKDRREGGKDLGWKGKCGSTQSKPCHMFQSAGISPPVQTRMLHKRLLIRESARRKMEFQLRLKQLSARSARNTVTWYHSTESRHVKV